MRHPRFHGYTKAGIRALAGQGRHPIDGKLRSNRRRPTIDDLKEHFSEVLAMVTNDEADQGGDDDNEVTPAAVGESAEVEDGHHDGAFHPEEPAQYARLP